jgi:DNA replication protein DnaC
VKLRMETQTATVDTTRITSSEYRIKPENIENPGDVIAKGMADLKLRHLSHIITRDFGQMRDEERTVFAKYMIPWIAAEKSERATAIIAARIRSAKFRKIQTVEMYDFKHSKLTERIEKSYLNLHQNLAKNDLPSAIFTGTAGVGKTHLARALGYAACQKGLSVLFLSAAEMVNQLSHAQKAFNLENELNKYRRPQVLIIDELGYVTLDAQASNLFFQVISARHDAGLGTIATTNLPFGKFNQIFANDAIAHAIVDRLVNEAEVFFMEGESYREHQRKEKSKKKSQPAET